MSRGLFALAFVCFLISRSEAQLPPDAVNLGKVKVSEKQKSEDLDPVTLEPSVPDGPAWEYKGVKYRGSQPDSKEKFMADPDKHAEAAAKKRWSNNFVQSLSRIWCPVTDEVTPGGMQEWTVEDVTWESCCTFCDTTAKDEDFVTAMERLLLRAEKSYELTKGVYVEGAKSPVEGAIDPNAKPREEGDVPAGEPAHDHAAAPADVPEPAYLAGKDLKPTWSGGVALVMENRCQSCHRPGEIAPMSFMTLGEVKKWTKSFKTSVVSRGMPPWPASSGNFFAAGRLTDKELNLLTAWADGGFQEGEPGYKPSKQWVAGWNIGEPDLALDIPEYKLAEKTTAEVKEFVVDPGLKEDRWVVASEIRPSDTFAIVQVDAGPLGSFNTGSGAEVLAPGVGRLVKAGEKIAVKVLYVKEAGFELPVAASKIGVKFAADPASIKHAELVARAAAPDFAIPAGAEAFEAKAVFEMPADGAILSLAPVMRARGKSVTATATTPDGKKTELVAIPAWQNDWRLRYQLAVPFAAPKGTKVEIAGKFDNSALNAKNPNAKIEVKSAPDGETLEGWVGYSLAK